MGNYHTEPGWLAIVRRQEERLRYKTFTQEMALELGMFIKEAVERRGLSGAAITVIEDGAVVFVWKMPGSSLMNDAWMQRKRNVSLRTGTSSLRACLEAEADPAYAFWTQQPNNYAACGGCFPVFTEDAVPCAYALVSGLQHYEDHQVIVDAMARQLGVEVESL